MGKIKARYDICGIFGGEDMSDCGRARRRQTQNLLAVHTPTPSATCASLPQPPNGPKTKTPRAAAAQKSRLSRRAYTRAARDRPDRVDSGGRMQTPARSRSSADTTYRTERTTTGRSHHPSTGHHSPTQIQQAVRRTPLVCTPPLHAPRTGPLPCPDGGPAPLQAL